MPQSPTNNSPRATALITYTGVVFLVALGIRLAHFEHEPITDELYHLLAADSWATDGSLDIADGEYTRSWAFTKMIGIVHQATDGSLDAIRVTCIVFGALLVAAVFAWTATYVGITEGAIAATLLAILPGAIFLSQYIRFYSLHALLFFLIAWCAWAFVYATSARHRLFAAAAFLPLALFATHLQVTTLVGIAGIALWAFLLRLDWLLSLVPDTRQRIIVVAAFLLVVAVGAFVTRDTIATLIETYRGSALWNSSDSPLYYHNRYRDDLGVLWALAPAAAVVALLARPAAAFYCLCIFSVAFVVQSFGGMRSERFMFYAQPFFLIVWGIAAAAAGRTLSTALRQALATPAMSRVPAARYLPGLLLTVVAGFALLTMPAFETFAKMTMGRTTRPAEYWDRYRTNWQDAAPHIRKLTDAADVTVASQPLHALYYLGDVDAAPNATMLSDFAPADVDAAMYPIIGRPVFRDGDSMQQLIACNDRGVVIVQEPAWRNPTRVPDGISDVIETYLEAYELPVKSDLLVYTWTSRPAGLSCERN